MVDITPFIELGIVATAAFVLAIISSIYMHKSANQEIAGSASTAIHAIVAMTGVGTVASQAAAVVEIGGVPTQIIKPPVAT
jgi:hypothetical protein